MKMPSVQSGNPSGDGGVGGGGKKTCPLACVARVPEWFSSFRGMLCNGGNKEVSRLWLVRRSAVLFSLVSLGSSLTPPTHARK